MGTTLAQAYVQVIPTTKGIKGMLGKELGNEGDSGGKTTGMKFTGAFKKAIAAAGIGTALAKTISEGAKLEQSIGGVETLFGKKDAETVKRNAQNAYKTLQISANDYMEQATSFSAALLQSLNGDTKKAAAAADVAITDMSDNANKMGTSIIDIQNAYQGFAKQNYTMLDNLKLGYGGTKTEMERLLSDASKLSGQKYDISNLSDVYSAIHVIQKEMKLTGTSAKEAKTTLSGSFNAMKAAASNFMGNIALGQNVGASMKGLVTTTTTWLFGNLIPAVGNVFKALPSAMGTFISQGVPLLISSMQGLLSSMANSMKGSGGIIENAFKGMLNLSGTIRASAPKLIHSGMQMLVNLAKGIAQAMPTIVATAPKIISNIANVINDNVPMVLATAAKIIWTLAKGLVQAIPTLIANIPAILSAVWDVWSAFGWANLGKAAITKIGSGLKSFGQTLALEGMYAMDAMKAGIVKGGSAIKGAVKGAFSKVGKFITSPFKSAASGVKSIVARIRSSVNFNSLVGSVKATFGRVKTALLSPIKAAAGTLKGIIGKIKGMFPFHLGRILNLKLPHISVSGGKAPYGIGGKGSLPSFGVNWYAKGGIVDGATLIGAGEAGPEGIVPLTPFWDRLDSTLAAMQNTKGSAGGNVTLVINLDGQTIAQSTVRYINNQTLMFGTSPLNV